MADNNKIRKGSLQFYPRVRAKRVIPCVNWSPIIKVSKATSGPLGFIGYKVAMVSVTVKDETADSLTKSKKIAIPATLIECPPMKIYSVRFYSQGRVVHEVVVSSEKILKRKIKLPKTKKDLTEPKEYDNIRIIAYSQVDSTSIGKKTPDFLEIALAGSKEDQLQFVKGKIGQDIQINEVFSSGLVDARAVTRGLGTQGPVKRFGISLKSHKSEKGRRRPGSLAPWHPARVTFRTAMMGQTGYHNRVDYNKLILKVGKISDKNINPKGGFKHYGNINSHFILVKGSIPSPSKRGLILTPSIKPSKRASKKKLEVLEMR